MIFTELVAHLRTLTPKHKQMLIGIDGGGGAGKSTLAMVLAEALGGSWINLDSLYKVKADRVNEAQDTAVNLDFDWDRIEREIFLSVRGGCRVIYGFYDWNKDEITQSILVPQQGPIIVEGGYALQRRFFDDYDYTIWIEVPEEVRLARVLDRDGDHMRPYWEKAWLPAERRYREQERPMDRASLLLKTGVI